MDWQDATLLKEEQIASNMKALTFSIPNWKKHQSGQYYDVRLTSANGMHAQRSFSIASAPEQEHEIEFGIQLLESGVVSPILFHMSSPEKLEVRGPNGGSFIWNNVTSGDPLILIGGGIGIVPLMSMLRHYHLSENKNLDKAIYIFISAKTVDRIPYYDELNELADQYANMHFVYSLTQEAPPDWKGYTKRLNSYILERELMSLPHQKSDIYVAGPSQFIENIIDGLEQIGYDRKTIHTERFGTTPGEE